MKFVLVRYKDGEIISRKTIERDISRVLSSKRRKRLTRIDSPGRSCQDPYDRMHPEAPPRDLGPEGAGRESPLVLSPASPDYPEGGR